MNITERISEYLKTAKDSTIYYTVAEYNRLLESQLNLKREGHWSTWRKLYKDIGIYASSICEERGIPVDDIQNKEFGRINKYQERILAEVIFGKSFREFFPNYSEYLNNQFPISPRIRGLQ